MLPFAVIPKVPEHAVGKPALNTLDGFEQLLEDFFAPTFKY
jgi:hypothetical protein